ncbi:transcriptional regulator [Paenibacillus sp. CAA11]|nr:transcriptional regulator [Paenibacillus sp. CAA11]
MNTPFCQSCSMPLTPEVLGTEKDGSLSTEYCVYCYDNGAFKHPDCTMEDMIRSSVPFMVQNGMDAGEAEALLTRSLPGLKRWSGTEPGLQGPDSFEERPAFQLAGISTRTTNAQEFTERAVIPQLWERFFSENIPGQLARTQAAVPEETSIYALYSDYTHGAAGEYTLLIGLPVAGENSIPSGLQHAHVPAAKYAVFTSRKGPMGQISAETWQRIWQWQGDGLYARTFSGDFEIYSADSAAPEEGQVSIYIAVAEVN